MAYEPPPPGSRERVLPPEILEAIEVGPYLSTACETAGRVEEAWSLIPTMGMLSSWSKVLHSQCRRTHKYTYSGCVCPCHEGEKGAPAASRGMGGVSVVGVLVDEVSSVAALSTAAEPEPEVPSSLAAMDEAVASVARTARAGGVPTEAQAQVLELVWDEMKKTARVAMGLHRSAEAEVARLDSNVRSLREAAASVPPVLAPDLAGLAQVLLDLDRCEHGVHGIDACDRCAGGRSAGNPMLPPGAVVGYDAFGAEIRVPARPDQFASADAWRRKSR